MNRLRIYADAADHTDCTEIRCVVGDVPAAEMVAGENVILNRHEDVAKSSYVLGTIHVGDWWTMNDMATQGQEDRCNASMQAWFSERVAAMLAAHQLEVDTDDGLNGMWRALDRLAVETFEPGPPFYCTVPVRWIGGNHGPMLSY